MKVIIIMGSESDKDWSAKIKTELDKWGLESQEIVASAHKVPEKVFEIISNNNQDQDLVYVTIAGRSNGLSGVAAANSVHPVIACPPFKDKAEMMVNLNSTLQMPSDTPVLTVLDPKNVAAAAARIFGLADQAIQNKVRDKIKEIKESFK